jgi:hypothetical protein
VPLSVRCRLALLQAAAALVLADTGDRLRPAVRPGTLLGGLPRGAGAALLLGPRLAEAERAGARLADSDLLRPPPFIGSSLAGREAERLPTARETVPTGFRLADLGGSCLAGAASALDCCLRWGFLGAGFALPAGFATGFTFAGGLPGLLPRAVVALPLLGGCAAAAIPRPPDTSGFFDTFPAAFPFLAGAATAAIPRPPDTSGLLPAALPLRLTGLAGASSSESDSSDPDSPLLLAPDSLPESDSSELDASASRIMRRTRGAASLMKRLIWMATLSFWHSQKPALTPTAIQDFVAKLVDSAQLKPWLKPEWYAPAHQRQTS